VNRVLQVWFHLAAVVLSVLVAFGVSRSISKSSGVERHLYCDQLVTNLEEHAVNAYVQQLSANLGRIEKLPAGLDKRAVDAWRQRTPLKISDREKVTLVGGRRFLQRDTEAAAAAVRFVCSRTESSEAAAPAMAAIFRDLAIAAYDAAEHDAESIQVKLRTAASVGSKNSAEAKPKAQAKQNKEEPKKKS